jgi:Spy/CpxP family protein refolding chaperone
MAMSFKSIVLGCVCAALLAPAAAGAQDLPPMPPMPPMPPGFPPHRDMKKVLRDVGLSADQVKRVEALHFEAEQQRIDIAHDLEKARLSLHQLLAGDAPEESAVFAQIEKIGALDIRVKKNRMGLLLKIRKLMTPAQWEKFHAESGRHHLPPFLRGAGRPGVFKFRMHSPPPDQP